MIDIHDGDSTRGVGNPLDDPVGATPGAEPVVQRRSQPLPDSVRLAYQWPGHELVRGSGHWFG